MTSFLNLGSGLYVERVAGKIERIERHGRFQENQCLLSSTRLTHIGTHRGCGRLWVCTGINNTESQCWEGKVNTDSQPNQEVICNWHLHARKKMLFSNGVSLGILSRIKGTCRAVHSQYQINSMIFLETFVSYYIAWIFFVLLVLCLCITISTLVVLDNFLFVCLSFVCASMSNIFVSVFFHFFLIFFVCLFSRTEER